MMSIFDPTLALTLLTHPFQVALMAFTLGAVLRDSVAALLNRSRDAIDETNLSGTDVPAAA